MRKAGKVYLVGAGPGDPWLLTIKGLKLLQSCDVVIYDRLVSNRLLDYVKEDCKQVYVGKTVGSHQFKQDEINQIIIENAFTHELVVRLKGGDPFVFGRGGEEILALKEQGIPYEVVPGVTSAVAAAAYAGIPITHRGSSRSFTVMTGHTADEENGFTQELQAFAKTEGTLVILMGIAHLDQIQEKLLIGGKSPDTPVAVVSNGTTPWQREVRGTLSNICEKVKQEKIAAPAIIIIGNVAELDMKSTIRYPLSGISVGITGTQNIRNKLNHQLEDLGAHTITVNALEVVQTEALVDFEAALLSRKDYHWIVFTSANAVEIFFDSLRKCSIDHRSLSHIRFAVVGSGTGEALLQYGYHADLMPEQYNVTQLALKLISEVKEGEKLLIPRARQGSEELPQILDQNQIRYEDYKIYDVVNKVYDTEMLQEQIGRLDYLTFSSSSGVNGLMTSIDVKTKELIKQIKLVCIGEATKEALIEYGLTNILTAKDAGVQGIVECIIKDVTQDYGDQLM